MTTIIENIKNYCEKIADKIGFGFVDKLPEKTYQYLPKYTDRFFLLTQKQVQDIKTNYKVIEVPYFEPNIIKYVICEDKYFTSNPEKEQTIMFMLDYYLSNPNCTTNKQIILKTDFICCEKERICLCNTNADNLRKTYDGENYVPNHTFVSWFREISDKQS